MRSRLVTSNLQLTINVNDIEAVLNKAVLKHIRRTKKFAYIKLFMVK